MNFERIRRTIDVDRLQQSHVTAIGSSVMLNRNLVRCGLGAITVVDFDSVDNTNPARQDFSSEDIGQYKVDAILADLKRVNPDVEVEVHTRDICELDEDEFDELFGHTDLFIFATDAFPAQARGNREAQRMGKPAVWPGLYAGGRAGEIVYHVPGVTPACYRCICESRYRAFASRSPGVSIPSDGGTIFDLHLLDAIAGQIAVGILTRGADNRMGRLIDKLNHRNLLQVKMDPDYRLGDRDIFAEHLGDGPANFSFTTIALPMDHDPACADCGAPRRPWEQRIMRRVFRRSITTDPQGRALHGDSERIADDGNGHLHAVVRRTTMTCQGCKRVVAEASELRGHCDHCRARRLCVSCEKHCAVCGRSLCGQCRRGFVGTTRMTVCPTCLLRLHQRQAYDDGLMLERIAFERHLHQQRELTRMDAMRLDAERLGLMADVQGARLRMAMQVADGRQPPSLLRLALVKAWSYGRKLLQ